MKEVSCSITDLLIKLAEHENYPVEEFLRGFPVTADYLRNPSNRIDWDLMVDLGDHAARLFGGMERATNLLGLMSEKVEVYQSIGKIAGFFLSPYQLYYVANNWFARTQFLNVETVMTRLDENRIKITVRIPAQYKGSEFFLRSGFVTERIIPRQLGLPDSKVEGTLIDDHYSEMVITMPKSRSFMSYVKKALSFPFAPRAAIRELERHRDELLTSYQAISKSQELAQMSRMAALGQLAGGMAHEVNNPLAVIQFSANHLSKNYPPGTPTDEQFISSVEAITRSTDRIKKIILSLLSFSKASPQETMQKVLVETIQTDLMNLLRESFLLANIKLLVDPVPSGATLLCRPSELTQVFVNLLKNAFDAVAHTDEKWVHFELKEFPSEFEFAVTDSGPGIPLEVRNRLFEPFFTTKEVGSGTGLGLSVARGIIAAHNGRLYLDTTSKHTRFVVRLPRTNS